MIFWQEKRLKTAGNKHIVKQKVYETKVYNDTLHRHCAPGMPGTAVAVPDFIELLSVHNTLMSVP